jgi:hypothetical protein
MTWNSITPQRFVELVNYWVNQDWPLTEDKLAAAMEKLGWDESDPSTIAKDIPVNQPRLSATTSDPVRGLDIISWSLTDIDTTKSVEQDRFMNDAFVGYVEAGTAVWGRPRIKRDAEREIAYWKTENGCEFQISNRRSAIAIHIFSPQYAKVYNSI